MLALFRQREVDSGEALNRESELLLTVTVVIAATQLVSQHLPPLYDTRVDVGSANYDFRNAQAQVAGLTLAGAAGVSIVARSWWPLFGAATILAALLAQYEMAVRANGNRDG